MYSHYKQRQSEHPELTHIYPCMSFITKRDEENILSITEVNGLHTATHITTSYYLYTILHSHYSLDIVQLLATRIKT